MAKTAPKAGSKASRNVNKGLLNYPRQGVTGWTRWLPSLRLLGVGILTACVAVIGLFSIGYALTDIPEPNKEAAGQTSTIYYDDGKTVLGTFKVENRKNVKINQISTPMQQAAIAAEDNSFYENRGISLKGLSRAVLGVATDNYAGGGSTITQQYVKNFYLTNERTIDRKVKEMFIALKIDQQLSKDEILANYLNTIFLGRKSYGIEVASQSYFDKPAKDLNLPESALLAAMIQRPGAADPADKPAEYESRFRYVLNNMAEMGYITQDEAKNTKMPQVKPVKTDNQFKGPNGYLLAEVRKELKANGVNEELMDRGGLEITSTFSKKKMDAAVEAVEDLPKLKQGMHVGLVSIDPETGGIVAMYGGKDYLERQHSAATDDVTQAGSTFKPFALVAGLENGFKLTDYFTGTSGTTMNYQGTKWSPKNYGGASYGPVSLLKATQNSVNTAYAQLNIDVGPEKTVDVAERAGLPKNTAGLEANAANVLGTASPTVKDMAGAYNTFAANGIARPTHSVQKAVNPNGKTLYEPDTEGERKFNQNVMAETTYALSRVITGGSGSYAANLGRPAAGKTGTSQDNYSAWFTGYTPNLTTAVSIFRENGQGHPVAIGSYGGRGSITGGSFPTQAWTKYMTEALEGEPVKKLPKRGPLPDVEKPKKKSGVPNQRPKPKPEPKPERPKEERPKEDNPQPPQPSAPPKPTIPPLPEPPIQDPPKPPNTKPPKVPNPNPTGKKDPPRREEAPPNSLHGLTGVILGRGVTFSLG